MYYWLSLTAKNGNMKFIQLGYCLRRHIMNFFIRYSQCLSLSFYCNQGITSYQKQSWHTLITCIQTNKILFFTTNNHQQIMFCINLNMYFMKLLKTNLDDEFWWPHKYHLHTASQEKSYSVVTIWSEIDKIIIYKFHNCQHSMYYVNFNHCLCAHSCMYVHDTCCVTLANLSMT